MPIAFNILLPLATNVLAHKSHLSSSGSFH